MVDTSETTALPPEVQGIYDAWAKYNKSWKSDEHLQTLHDELMLLLPVAQAKGYGPDVHNAISSFIHEVEARHLDHELCGKLAEGLTEFAIETGNEYATAAINTLVFSLFFSKQLFRESETWLEKSILMETGSESENSLNNLGISYMMQGRVNEAIAIFVRAVALGGDAYRPEALFCLVHLMGKCNSSNWSKDALHWISQESDSQYSRMAQSCLRGRCQSRYRFGLGSKSYKFLGVTRDNYSEVLVELHQAHEDRWDAEQPLHETGLSLDNFYSPLFTLKRINTAGGFDAELLEFCAQTTAGQSLVYNAILALTLESGLEPSFSTFGAELVCLWGLGETILILNGLAQEPFLGQPDFDPGLHPGVNFAIHETLLRTLRTGQGYVAYAEDLVQFEKSVDSAAASKYLDSLIEQRLDGNLQNFHQLLRESVSGPEEWIPRVSRLIAVASLFALDLVEAWDGKSQIPNLSQRWADALDKSGFASEAPELTGVADFLRQRFMFLRGDIDSPGEVEAILHDSDFLARAVFLMTAGNFEILLDDCLMAAGDKIVSTSLLPVVDLLARIAWIHGASFEEGDTGIIRLASLQEFITNSYELREISKLLRIKVAAGSLQNYDSLGVRLVGGVAGPGDLEVFMKGASDRQVLLLSEVRGLSRDAYLNLEKRFGLEALAKLATNPDGFEAVREQVIENLKSKRDFGYLCAKYFTETKEGDWPRGLVEYLVRTENTRALILLAADQRLADHHLREIASKANKEIASVLNDNPKASDETRALAQLVA